MTDQTDAPETDRERIVRLIRARCPELSDADLATLAAAPDPDALPAKIGEQILEVLSHLMDRMDGLERLAGRAEA
jgi:hypothetical protein